MVIKISSALLDALLDEAAKDPMREVCGLLLGDTEIRQIVPVTNVANDSFLTFEIDPARLFAAIRVEREGGPRLLGYYHSHPTGDCRPSESDRAQADPDGRVWMIVANGQVAAWRLSMDRIFETVGIERA